jgi:hypothetical protein
MALIVQNHIILIILDNNSLKSAVVELIGTPNDRLAS